MMWLWSHRPRLIYLGAFFAAYFLGCAFAEVLGIVPGTDIAIWPPGGVFMATLMVTPPRTWPWWILVGCLAELLGQLVWFHSPLAAGFFMYAGNALEATAGAFLVNRAAGRPVRLDTLREVLAFVVLGAIVAPALSATVGAATLVWFDIRSQTFIEAWPLWWIGDATGVLLVAPFALAVLQNWRSAAPLSAARWIEAAVLGLIFFGVAAFSLSGPLPFAYLIMPPLLWAAVRFEFRGAVIALTILAFITIAFTISGAGEFAGDPESQREKLIMLQLFLAISAFSALIVAAISRQHHLGMLKLRQSMDALREREARIQRLVDSDLIGIVFWDMDGRIIDANDAFLRMVQYDRSDMQAGLRWFDMTPPEWQEVHVREEAEELRATGMMQAREKEYFRKDGSRAPVLIGAACFEGQPMQGVAYILDLTERKRAEAALREREGELHRTQERLAQASQAASLAELAASIAHEVNQPLAAVVANSHACQRWLTADPPNLERAQLTVERIIRDANGAADVVSRIRALFRQNVMARSGASLTSTIADAKRWVSDLAMRHGVVLDMRVEPGVPPVAIDQVQIQQVLINLMRNAVEAMAASPGARTLGVSASTDGDVVRVEVRDTGPGVEDAEKIFDAFFTTKASGMGMGLAVSRSIVESHGGRLWAEQNQGGGARFVFTLPIEGPAAS